MNFLRSKLDVSVSVSETTRSRVKSAKSLSPRKSVPNEIQKCRCNKYIPNDQFICGCGRPRAEHSPRLIKEYNDEREKGIQPVGWDPVNHTAYDGPTDAYGEFIFEKFDRANTTHKYIRVHHKTDMKTMLDILFKEWKIPLPNLIISVTGGAKNFTLNPDLKTLFRQGLIKAALSTNALIITGGTNEGCMKLVGDVLRDNIAALDPKKNITLLGITNWTTIANNRMLIRAPGEDDTKPKKYRIEISAEIQADKNIKVSALNPNHTHFIMVDNAKLNVFGGEIDFRSDLINEIAEYDPDKTNEKKNTVVLVVSGGPNTLGTVLRAVQSGSPCVFIAGSGEISDLMAFTIRKTREGKRDMNNKLVMSPELEREVYYKMTQYKFKEKDLKNLIETLKKILEFDHLLNVFYLDPLDHGNVKDIDETILHSIIRAKSQQKKDETESKKILKSQLQLALTWNRIDIVEKFILTNKEKTLLDPEMMGDLMYTAIKLNRVDFAIEFLENGIILNNFLTYRRLLKLYNDVPRDSLLFQLLLKYKRNKYKKLTDIEDIVFRFKDIGKLTESLLGHLYKHPFTMKPFTQIGTLDTKKILRQTDDCGKATNPSHTTCINVMNYLPFEMDDTVKNPEQELFMYLVLINRTKMADIFGRKAKNDISNCLIASKILKSYSKVNYAEINTYLKSAKEYEQQALGILDLAYEAYPEKAKHLLMREVPEYGNVTPLIIARFAEDLDFLNHNCVQSIVIDRWYSKLQPDNYKILLMISVLLPFLAPFVCKFKERRQIPDTSDFLHANGDEIEEDLILSKSCEPENKLKIGEIPTFNRVKHTKSYRDLRIAEKFIYFIRAPFVKFCHEKIGFIFFLILFSYVMLCDFYPIYYEPMNESAQKTHLNIRISIIEVVVIIWVFSYMIDSIRQFVINEGEQFRAKVHLYFYSFWNFIDLAAYALFIVGMILRFIPDSQCYLASRVILCLDLVFWYFKSLHAYTYVRFMGPKLIMIRRMSLELFSFFLLVLIFMYAFGIASTALLYHNLPPDSQLLKYIFFPAYFMIGGEYFTRDPIMNSATCEISDPSRSTTDVYSLDDCPDNTGSQVTLGIYAVYVMLMSVLLCNLLIAIFSNTYNRIEKHWEKIWKNQRYTLVYDYFHKPMLLPPFSIFYYITYTIVIFARILRRFSCLRFAKPNRNNQIFFDLITSYKNGFRLRLDNAEQGITLANWEKSLFDEYETNQEELASQKMDSKLEVNFGKLKKVNQKCNKIIESKRETAERIAQVERQVESLLELIKNR